MKKLLLCFSAGCLGALANSLTVWFFGDYGISKSMGVAIAPALSPAWLYPRIVWGGLWGLLFVLPVLNARASAKGTILSLFPTLFQLLVVFPYETGYGMFGLKLGMLTPALVFFFNWVWGIITALTIKLSR
jgi:hypothetical protein